ncbi:MAG: exodeoxyribonuclease III [Chitinophagales bacterium]|nr:exodeoxyribonuclease III [Chitinophagales bacterium]MDW8418363.1 exodeoxyribonuclease III [Chitinophagales bacterium]
MKIISYNVNGLRSALGKGFLQWLQGENPDVLCLQEIKVSQQDFDPVPFRNLGYETYIFPAEKKGYSGVAIFTKLHPDDVIGGINHPLYDREGRNLRIDAGELSILCTYFPSGTTGDERQAVKMEYLDYFFEYIAALRNKRPYLLIAGDFNICHREIDIHNPKENANTSGFKPEERAWMEKFFQSGFIDTFRYFNPQPHAYSWWSFRANARQKNKGWRIDYIAATQNLQNRLVSACMQQHVVHSDHCPVVCEIK